jgi:hypothetical protein
MNAAEYAKALRALKRGALMAQILNYALTSGGAQHTAGTKAIPACESALLNHHTSGVRMEWYRDDIEKIVGPLSQTAKTLCWKECLNSKSAMNKS